MRPATPEDYGFALALYLETIRPHAAQLIDWRDEAEADRFAGFWRTDEARIVVLDSGDDIGWVQIEESPEAVALRQFYLSPAHQGRGIGSQVLARLVAEWGGRPARLSVLRNNPARRLYERFGFVVCGESGFKVLMRRSPEPT